MTKKLIWLPCLLSVALDVHGQRGSSQFEFNSALSSPRDALASFLFTLHPAGLPTTSSKVMSSRPMLPISTRLRHPIKLEESAPPPQSEEATEAASDAPPEGEAAAPDDFFDVDTPQSEANKDPEAKAPESEEPPEPEKPKGPPHLENLASVKELLASGNLSSEALGPLEKQLNEYEEKVDKLKVDATRADLQYSELLPKYRQLAEQNTNLEGIYTKRVEMKAEETKAKMLKELFPVLDNFDRAREGIKPQNDGEQDIANQYNVLVDQTLTVFANLGVVTMGEEQVGQPFDPNKHEAIQMQPTDQFPDETVMALAGKGFLYGDKLLRAAKVLVAQNDEDREAKEAAAPAEEKSQEETEKEA